MSILSFLGTIISPITKLIDSLHTSDAEKGEIKNELVKLENAFAGKVLEYETKLMEAQATVITAEATGHSWLQRNWRPLCMVSFLALIICDSFGFLTVPIADQMWTLLQLGIGGYIGGRSLEKIAKTVPTIVKAIKEK